MLNNSHLPTLAISAVSLLAVGGMGITEYQAANLTPLFAGSLAAIALWISHASTLPRPLTATLVGTVSLAGALLPYIENSADYPFAAPLVALAGTAITLSQPHIPTALPIIAPIALAAEAAAPNRTAATALAIGGVALALIEQGRPTHHLTASPTPTRQTDPGPEPPNIITIGQGSRAAGLIGQLPVSTPPYASSRSSDEYVLGDLHMLAHSRRGSSHVHNSSPRQDDYAMAVARNGEFAVFAIADGLGSASRSHIGSYWVSRIAVDVTAKRLATEPLTANLLQGVVESLPRPMTWAARTVSNAPADSILSTLVLAVVPTTSNQQTIVSRVGDSDCLLLNQQGTWRSIFHLADTAPTAATTALPHNASSQEIATAILAPGDRLAIGTDGVCDLILHNPNSVGATFAKGLLNWPTLEHFERLVGFDRRGAHDDRTLVAVRCSDERK